MAFSAVIDAIRLAVIDRVTLLHNKDAVKTTVSQQAIASTTAAESNTTATSEKLASGRSSCRTCTDFQTFVMNRRNMSNYSSGGGAVIEQQLQAQSSDAAQDEYRRKNCPLDKDELGRSTWNLLHTIAATYPDEPTVEQRTDVQQFLLLLSRVYPCEICASDFAEVMTHHPPRTNSQESLSQWMCEVHNMVNRKLSKPQFDCTKVIERWRDGWKDGRCD